uniref:Uncharacterized protein n=1 Tax=Arundo donax TaxID=35708 RepID=A0A0A9GGN2_ARUDO
MRTYFFENRIFTWESSILYTEVIFKYIQVKKRTDYTKVIYRISSKQTMGMSNHSQTMGMYNLFRHATG